MPWYPCCNCLAMGKVMVSFSCAHVVGSALVACGRVVGGVVSLDYPIGGFGCLGAADLAHCFDRVVCPCFLMYLVALPGLWADFIWLVCLMVCLIAWPTRLWGLVLVFLYRADAPFPMF